MKVDDRLYDSNYFCPLPQSLQCPILPNPLPYLLWLARWGWPSTSTLTSLPNASPSPPPLYTQLLYLIYIPLYAPLLNMTVYTSSHYIYPPISIPLWQFVCKSSAHVNHRSHAFLSFFLYLYLFRYFRGVHITLRLCSSIYTQIPCFRVCM